MSDMLLKETELSFDRGAGFAFIPLYGPKLPWWKLHFFYIFSIVSSPTIPMLLTLLRTPLEFSFAATLRLIDTQPRVHFACTG